MPTFKISIKRDSIAQIKKDLSQMTREELAKVARPYFANLNKRIDRLDQHSELVSPALRAVDAKGGKFSIKGLSRNELLKEISRALAFDNSQTSTIQGARNYTNQTLKPIFFDKGITDEELIGKFFDIMHRYENANPAIAQMVGSETIINEITAMLSNEINYQNMSEREWYNAIDETLANLEDKMTEIYEETIEDFEDSIIF